MTAQAPLPDEFALIARLFAPLAQGAPGAYGLLDDAATLALPPGEELVLTKDLIVEGVHYLPDDPAELVARKLMRVNLSDLAAKGAKPLAYLLGLALPRGVSLDWLDRFAAGLAHDQSLYDLNLIGGDTTATPGPAVLSLTALGSLPVGTIIRRGGAVAGDRLYVSGTIGDGALGLMALRGAFPFLAPSARDALIARYRLPEPRLALGARLRGLAHAALDVSDGLVADLGHLCAVSGVGAELEAARVPLSPAAAEVLGREPGLLSSVLGGGDDYELLFAAPPEAEGALRHAAREGGVPLAAIGTFIEGAAVSVRAADGGVLALERGGYRHF
jgi:thiamine-monophosphate kinase